jgi:hypothetical protein
MGAGPVSQLARPGLSDRSAPRGQRLPARRQSYASAVICQVPPRARARCRGWTLRRAWCGLLSPHPPAEDCPFWCALARTMKWPVTPWRQEISREIERRISPHLNRRQPPTVRNDGSFPASAHRRIVRGETANSSATSPSVSISPSSYSGSRTSTGAAFGSRLRFGLGSRLCFGRVGRFRAGAVAMRLRKALRISASSADVNVMAPRVLTRNPHRHCRRPIRAGHYPQPGPDRPSRRSQRQAGTAERNLNSSGRKVAVAEEEEEAVVVVVAAVVVVVAAAPL